MIRLLKTFTILIFVSFLAVSACDDGAESVGSFDSGSGTEDPPPQDADSATALQVKFLSSADDEEDFEMFSYQVLPTFDATSECTIETTETSNQDLTCVTDVNEQDLYFHGLRLEFVIPTGMCDYFRFRNHWHWDQEAGSGPPNVWLRTYTNDAGEVSGTPECFVQNSDGVWSPSDPSADGLPADGAVLGTGDNCAALTAGAAGLELDSIDEESGLPKCVYDNTLTEGDNCCSGLYNITREIVDNQDTPASASVAADPISKGTEAELNLSYGTSGVGQCLSGPGAFDSEWPGTTDGIPRAAIYYTRETGLSDRYVISPAVEVLNEGQNQAVANWHEGVQGVSTRHQHAGTVSGRTSFEPIFHDPIEDRSGDYFHTPGQSPYQFECLDEDLEIIHRVNLYVREYNSRAEFASFIANPVDGNQDADRTGTEGGGGANDCEGFLGGVCNDRSDADDFNPDTPGDVPPYDCNSSEGSRFSSSLIGCFPYATD